MNRAKKIDLRGTVAQNNDAVAKIASPGDCVIVHRSLARSVVMVCPDGCGSVLTINVDRRCGRAWDLYLRKEQLSIFPSYWRADGCLSHFIVWRNRILWCDSLDFFEPQNISSLNSSVLARLSVSSYISYQSIANEIDEIPWDVLWSCRSLVLEGLAEEHAKLESFMKSRFESSGGSDGEKEVMGSRVSRRGK